MTYEPVDIRTFSGFTDYRYLYDILPFPSIDSEYVHRVKEIMIELGDLVPKYPDDSVIKMDYVANV